jgi:hypothetical protein
MVRPRLDQRRSAYARCMVCSTQLPAVSQARVFNHT